jgi:hypothetical protein
MAPTVSIARSKPKARPYTERSNGTDDDVTQRLNRRQPMSKSPEEILGIAWLPALVEKFEIGAGL